MAVSKTAGWGFDPLLACQDIVYKAFKIMGILKKYRTTLQVASIFGLMFIIISGDMHIAIRISATLSIILINLFIMHITGQLSELIKFIGDAKLEIAKVVWPSKQEAIRTTGMIAMVVLVVSILLWLLDSITLAIFAKLIQII